MGIIRLLLALAVVLEHGGTLGGWKLVPGAQAVQLFFVISGFYMALVLHEKYPATPAGSRTFWWARVMRIFPCYWLVLLAAAAAYFITWKFLGSGSLDFGWTRPDAHPGWGATLAFIVANIVVLGQDALLFFQLEGSGLAYAPDLFAAKIPAYRFILIPPAWSISMELMFYGVAPFLVRRSWPWLAGLMALCFGLKAWLYWGAGLVRDPWVGRFFPAAFGYFLIGVLAYRLLPRLREAPPHRLWQLVPIAFLASVVFWEFIDSPAAYALQFVLLAGTMPLAMYWWGRNRVDRWIGELSYPIYIVHLLVMLVLSKLKVPWGWWWLLVITGVAVAIQVLFDQPLERYRQRRIEQAKSRQRSPVTSV